MASKVNLAATSATLPAPFVITMKLIMTRIIKMIIPTAKFPPTTKDPNDFIISPAALSPEDCVLNKIFRSFGYGGGIHYFKNYILRKDEYYKINAKNKLEKVIKYIDEYRNFSRISETEIETLQVIYNSASKYLNNLKIAEKKIKLGLSIKEIDKFVKVDDTPAILSIKKLQEYFIDVKEERYSELKKMNKKTYLITTIIFISCFILSIIASFSLSKDILNSIKKIKIMAQNISKGRFENTSFEIENISNDELKSLTNEILKMKDDLKNTFTKLEKSNEELSNYAYVASHDLQEPMKKISTYIDLMELEVGEFLSNTGKDYIKEIKSSSKKMINLIHALLNYSRISNLEIEYETLDLNILINEVINNLELLIEENNVQTNIDNFPEVLGNKELLSILFQNLISNSIKYRKKDETPLIEIKCVNLSLSECKINFLDNGIGFDMKYLDVILRPFGRIHSSTEYSGLGIGLPLCKKIVESHGHKLEIDSEENRGSIFSFKLTKA